MLAILAISWASLWRCIPNYNSPSPSTIEEDSHKEGGICCVHLSWTSIKHTATSPKIIGSPSRPAIWPPHPSPSPPLSPHLSPYGSVVSSNIDLHQLELPGRGRKGSTLISQCIAMYWFHQKINWGQRKDDKLSLIHRKHTFWFDVTLNNV